MTTKSLKKFAELLNRSEGISLTPIIVIMVIMSVMGGVFTSIMGVWKVSAPLTVNSNKVFFQAETAAMFALQDAQYRFYSKDPSGNDLFNYGTSTADPYVVSSVTTGNVTEEADYWFERPGGAYIDDDGLSDPNDDNVDDDTSVLSDDATFPNRYTIIATGTVTMGGATMAKRQIKVLADINPSAANTVVPGVQTNGEIWGTAGGFGIDFAGAGDDTVVYDNGGPDSKDPFYNNETDIVFRPVQDFDTEDIFDEYFIKALATDQSHVPPGDHTVTSSDPNYPTASFYYHQPTNMPNFTYIDGDLTVEAGCSANGVIWVTGDVELNDTLTMNAIIICEGVVPVSGVDYDIEFNDSVSPNSSNIIGGIIHYGAGRISGNGNLNAVVVDQAYYDDLSATVPDIDVVSWNETVSAN